MLSIAYRLQLGCLLKLTHFDKGKPWTKFQHMRLRKQTNKQTNNWKNKHDTTRGTWPGLSRNHNSVAEETLRFLFFLCDLLYNVFFELLSFESLPFFSFKDVAQCNRFNFISSYGRKQPPNNGRRTGGEKWVSSHRWEKATGRDFVVVILYCLLIKYILILVHNFLDQFDSKVLRNPLNTPVLER